MQICIYEDNGVGRLQPLIDTRPAFDLRCGAQTLLQRQLHAFGAEQAFAFIRPELADLCRLAHPELTVNSWEDRHDKVLFVNARWLVAAHSQSSPKMGEVGLCDGQVAYVCLPAGEVEDTSFRNLTAQLEQLAQKSSARPCEGRMIVYPWDLLRHHAEVLEQDHLYWGRKREATTAVGTPIVGPSERCLVHPSARVEPMVLIDTTRGPVLIDADAIVQAFSRIEGPCYIGPRTQVLGAKVRGSSVGPECRIGGEVEASIIQGFSNKAHEGFLGHSYLGEWVNLGAGTQVSDLRTDYANVRIKVGSESIDTGMIKVGAFVGDHTRTSISALVNTGSVFGTFSQLLTSGSLLPRSLPTFSSFGHGEIRERNDLRELFASAAVAMARRGQEWTETHAEFYFDLHDRTSEARRRHIRESEQRRLRRAV